jgi:hypothetical protein
MSTINVDIIQSASASNVTVDGNLVVTGTNDIRPYKVYSALLTQTGTNAPTAVVLENTIGDIFLSRVGIGDYRITSNNLFTADKSCLLYNSTAYTNGEFIYAGVGGLNFCQIITKTQNGDSSDDLLLNLFVEVRVYN